MNLYTCMAETWRTKKFEEIFWKNSCKHNSDSIAELTRKQNESLRKHK